MQFPNLYAQNNPREVDMQSINHFLNKFQYKRMIFTILCLEGNWKSMAATATKDIPPIDLLQLEPAWL